MTKIRPPQDREKPGDLLLLVFENEAGQRLLELWKRQHCRGIFPGLKALGALPGNLETYLHAKVGVSDFIHEIETEIENGRRRRDSDSDSKN